jgi:hypothetical protein
MLLLTYPKPIMDGIQGVARGEHRSRVPLPEPRPHDGDIGRHKRRQDEPANVCSVLKVETPGPEAKERRINSWDTRFGPRK